MKRDRAGVSNLIPLRAVLGFCLPLGGWVGHGLVIAGDWVGGAGVERAGAARASASLSPGKPHNSGPIAGRILPTGHVFHMSG